MAAPTIKIKRSAVSGNAPTTSQLELGELALNTYDGKLFTEINTGSASIIEIGSNLNTLQVNTITSNVSFTADATFTGDDYNVVWDKSDNQLEFGDNAKAVFGTGSDLSIYHNGSNSYISDTGALFIQGSYVILESTTGENYFKGTANGSAELYYDNALKLSTTSTGIQVGNYSGNPTITLAATQSGPSRLNFFDNNATEGVTLRAEGATAGGQLVFCNQWSGETDRAVFDAGTNPNFTLYDSVKLQLGSDADIALYHDGSNAYIDNDTGGLRINTASDEVQINKATNEYMGRFITDGAVELYHNNIKTFETTSTGITVLGTEGGAAILRLHGDEGDDNSDKWSFVAASGSSTFRLRNFASGSWENSILATGNGAVELYYDNALKLATSSTGVTVTGTVTADAITLGDSESIRFGASNDLTIQHNGSHSYIADTGTGDLRITGSAVHIQNAAQSENMIKCFQDGQVELYHNNVKRIQTSAGGAIVTGGLRATGIVTATHGFSGNINSTGISTISGFTFPSTDGSEDQSLVTDGNGGLSFKTISGGGGGTTGTGTSLSSGITTATQGQTSFTAPNVFDDGEQATAFSTQVYVNGVKQRLGASNDYQLSAPQTVTLNSGANVGDDVTIVVYFGHTLEEEFFTATQGQTTFSLAGNLSSAKNYKVFLNGVRLRNTVDYNATSAVVLNQAAREGEQIDICSDQAEDRLTANEGQTSFAPSDSNTTSTNMQVYMNGILLRQTEDWTIGSPAVTIINQSLTVGDEVDVVVRRS